jgi:phenylacetate-coenzyme A ligase PaaK-like adenylate-forming protein
MTVQANKPFSGSQWSEIESLAVRDARRLQDERLREQMAYLAARSTFYQVKFAEHGVDPGAVQSVDDLAGLPFTEKQELRESLAAFPPLGSHIAAAADEIVRIQASSGTSGSPSYVGLTAPDVRTWCELGARALYANGFRPGDRLLHAFGMSKGWGECEAADGMHFLSPDLMVAELIDPETGERVAPAAGARGELVYTALRRQASPLLRFRTRDHVVVTGTSCSCGRTGYKVRCLGRTDDMLIVRGINLFPSAVQDLVLGLRPAATGEMRIRVDFEGHSTQKPLPLVVEYAADLEAGRRDELRRTVEGVVRSALNVKTVVELVPEGTLRRPGHVKVALIERANG